MQTFRYCIAGVDGGCVRRGRRERGRPPFGTSSYRLITYVGTHERPQNVGCLRDCLERNESAGVVYHCSGIVGDYDDFDDQDTLMAFIECDLGSQRSRGAPTAQYKVIYRSSDLLLYVTSYPASRRWRGTGRPARHLTAGRTGASPRPRERRCPSPRRWRRRLS